MCIDGRLRRIRSWRRAALQASAFGVLIAGAGSLAAPADASAQARAGEAQTTVGDPCRFVTAEAMGKAFGRPMKSSKLADVCQYSGTPAEVVVVRVNAGREGTIFGHVKTAAAQGQKAAENVKTAVGESYFDSSIPAFVGRVGTYNVQIESSIQPVPRDAMIAVGTRIMENLAGK